MSAVEDEMMGKYSRFDVDPAPDAAAARPPVADSNHLFRIQEIDNRFFEKLGSFLKDSHEEEEEEEEMEKAESAEVENASSPLEQEEIEGEKARGLISDVVGLNIDELYEEVLYEIIHAVGADAEANDEETLFNYVQETFKIDKDKHEEAVSQAKEKEAPSILLNVEVIQAKELHPLDSNGLSDPFVTIYLNKNSSHRYNTSVKTATLNPCWEEYFSLPTDNKADGAVVIEVWDFDPAETIKEKMSKITGVKGVRGFSKLVKEIAVTASTGKHDNELIGMITIPLKSIPSSGHVKWYHLEKKNSRNTKRGTIQLKLALGAVKNNQVAAQEHRHLLRLILLHEMEYNKPDVTTWDGSFQGPADIILRQHAALSGLKPTDEKMAEWVEYTRLHSTEPLNFNIFSNNIVSVVPTIMNGLYPDDEVKLFWDATKRLLPSIFLNIRKLRKQQIQDTNCVDQLGAMLSVLAELSKLHIPENIELFPTSSYGWMQEADKVETSIEDMLVKTINHSASEWFTHVMETSSQPKTPETGTLNSLDTFIKVIQHVKKDIQKSMEHYDKVFHKKTKIHYAKLSYMIYDAKIAEIAEPLVQETHSSIKPIKFKGMAPDVNQGESEPLILGTSLFKLYRSLQVYTKLGQNVLSIESDDLMLSKCHVWFHKVVAHWLDIVVYKSLKWIEKAVEVDNLSPIDDILKLSSSSTDILSIYSIIKDFWNDLAWPDVESSYTFVAKIMDDICRCSVFYADQMASKVFAIGEVESSLGRKFVITNEWCMAVNGIDHVRQAMEPFLQNLGVEDIVKKLADLRSASAAEHCKETLIRVVENTIDTVGNKIVDLMVTISVKMSPTIKRFLLEGAEIINEENNHMEQLIRYLDDSLSTLHSQLSSNNFDRMLSILWENVYSILMETFNDSIVKKRPPIFFENLNRTLDMLVGLFCQKESVENCDSYHHIKNLLRLHAMSTDELILTYYLERLSEQVSKEGSSCGILTVKMQWVHSLLKIEILNCRNLLPHDSNGSCDPFVKVHLLPEERFYNISKPRTKIQKKNLFPLFDETFSIQLTPEQAAIKSALVHFVVKDQDFLGMSNDFVAEAFVPFSDIPHTSLETSIHEMKQVHLKLTKPTSMDSEVVRAIEHRNGEKLARDFIKRQKAKQQNLKINNNHK